MRNTNIRKLLAVMIVLVLVLQFMPLETAFAASGGSVAATDLTGTEYLTTSVNNVTIMSGSTPITPVGGVYSNVPANATLAMDVNFWLSDGAESDLFTYDGSEYFTVALPDGLTFDSASGTISASHTGSSEYTYDIATFSISDTTMTVRLTGSSDNPDTTGHGGAANPDHFGKHATIHVEGTFKKLHAGDDEQTVFTIGGQKITINREPLPMNFLIDKSYVGYDASTNELSWKVVLSPPEDYDDLPFNGLTLSDTLSGSHSFVDGSFKLNDNSVSPEISGATVSYKFEDSTKDITGTQTFTYKTKPSAFNPSANASSTFGNTAALKNGTKTLVSDSESTSLKWISKSGTKLSGTTVIQWTITVTVPGNAGKAVTGAQIIDTIPAGLALIEGSSTYPVTIQYGSGAAQTITTGYTLSDGKLTYTFPADAQPTADTAVILRFYTSIDASLLNSYLSLNTATKFTNTASFDWDQNPSASNPSGSSGSGDVIGAGGILSKSVTSSTSDYVYSASDYGTMNWTINVNKNKASLTGAVLSDIVQAGHELIIDSTHPFTVKKGSDVVFKTETTTPALPQGFTYTDAATVSYNFGNISDTYTVTFSTRVNSAGVSLLYGNGTAVFQNNSTLDYNGDMQATSNAKKTYNIQMLKKASGAYDYNTKLTKWTLTVNSNKLPLTDAVVTDTLPDGMSVDTAIHDFEVFINGSATSVPLATAGITYTATATGFTLALPASTSDKFVISFYTKLSDTALKTGLPWTSDKKDFRNNASLEASEITTPVTSYADVTVKNPVIKKVASYTTGNDIIDWTATINNDRILLANGFVTDTMSTNVVLEPDSVKLWSVGIDSSSGLPNLSPKTLVAKSSDANPTNTDYAFSIVGNVLTVYLPTNTDSAYILEYRTHATSENITVSNHIELSDSTSIANNTAVSVNVSTITSIGGSYSNSITVHKTDGHDKALEGAVFQLFTSGGVALKRSGAVITSTTDSNGNAEFKSLPAWSYIVREITPPAGYFINGANTTVTSLSGSQVLNLTNTLALTDVSFKKTGANGAALTGGDFTLTGKDYADNDVTRTAHADNGLVTFKNVPLGKTGEPYTITETAAPTGHTASTATLSATVVYSSDYSKLDVTITPDAPLFNKPHTTEVSFTKTDLNGTALAGGSFTLTGTDYESKPVSKTAAAGADGAVTFSDVPIGSYTVYENTPPTGYLRPASEAILDVTVAYTTNKDALAVAITGKDDNAASYDTGTNSFKNSLGTASVGIDKVGAGVSLSGGKFTLTGTAAHNGQTFTIEDIAADASGKVSFSNVPIGSYTIRETATPTGHQLNDAPIYVTVGYNTDKTAVVVKYGTAEDSINQDSAALINTPIPAAVSFTKTDLEGKPISGGSFSLYQGTTQIGSAVTAGADGTVTFSGIPIGSYTVYEDDSPSGYLMPGTTSYSPAPAPVSKQILHVAVAYNEAHTGLVVTITDPMVDSGTTPVVSYANDPALGELHFKKVDAQNHSKLLSGGQFELTGKDYADRTVKMTASADKDGIVSFTDIPLVKEGTVYTVTEVTPPTGYRLTNDPMRAVVAYTTDKTGVQSYWLGKDGPLEGDPLFENLLLPPTGYIEIVKTDDNGVRLPGAEFTLYNSTGQALKTAVSDENGIAKFSEVAINQTYTIRETKTPEGYESSKDVISFMLSDNQTRTFTVVNKKLVEKSGSINILKTDESGAPLSGAEFTLYDKDGKALETVVTQADGTAKFANLPAGSYTVSETRAPMGYTILTGKTPVTLNNKQSVSLSFVNKKDLKATGVLQLLKVDKDYHPLSGAEFTLYDKDGNELAKSVSGSDGLVLFSDLASGSYTVKETVAPKGYKLFSEPLTVQISASDPVLSYTLKDLLLTDDTGVEGWNDNNNGGTLPKTGGIPWTFYLLLGGLGSLLTGLGLMRPERKRGKHLPKNK